MSKITVACAALSGRIFAGRINTAGTAFLDGKQDVTSDVLKAVIDKVKPGHIETVTVDGAPKFEIEVREAGSSVYSICDICAWQGLPGCRIAGLGVTGAIKACPKFKA